MKRILIPTLIVSLLQLAKANLSVLSRSREFDSFTNSTIPAKLSNFGFIQEDTNRIGKLIIPNADKAKGCTELKPDDFDADQFSSLNGQSGYFLLLERGDCNFQTKIKNAMGIGCSVLIISDYLPDEKKYSRWADPKSSNKSDEGVLQAHIPTFEISNSDASILKKAYSNGESIYLNANTKTGTEDNTVEVDLWYSSSLDLGLKLANEFAALSYSFTECKDCSTEMKTKDCVSDGLYCAYTPRFVETYGINKPESNFELTGREVII